MNAFHCPIFQGQKTFDAALKKIQQLLEPFVDEFIKVASELTFEATQCLDRTKSTNIYGRVTSIIQVEHYEFVQSKLIPVFKNACYEALRDEATFGTTNLYFDSKFREDEICPPELISLFAEKAEALLKEDTKSPMSSSHKHVNFRNVKAQDLQQCLEEAAAEVAHNQVHSSLMETQKKRVYSAVIANFDVEKKTFVDVLLKKLKNIVVKGHLEYVETEILRSSKILEEAREDEPIRKHREDLLAKEKRLEECLSLLHDVPFPSKKVRHD